VAIVSRFLSMLMLALTVQLRFTDVSGRQADITVDPALGDRLHFI
jgi:hypothetical protein